MKKLVYVLNHGGGNYVGKIDKSAESAEYDVEIIDETETDEYKYADKAIKASASVIVVHTNDMEVWSKVVEGIGEGNKCIRVSSSGFDDADKYKPETSPKGGYVYHLSMKTEVTKPETWNVILESLVGRHKLISDETLSVDVKYLNRKIVLDSDNRHCVDLMTILTAFEILMEMYGELKGASERLRSDSVLLDEVTREIEQLKKIVDGIKDIRDMIDINAYPRVKRYLDIREGGMDD